jgi:CheY-like chemotaxis protein
MDAIKGYLLVVEDVPDTLQMLDVALTFKGYRVVTARDGQQALKAIQKERPALIIADILMPRMDGFSLAHRLRVNHETRNIPIVFLSATYVTPEDKQFAAAIGVTRFIEKPVAIEDLVQAISELLSHALPDSKPLDTQRFYVGYRKRLEAKLKQKVTQIARNESMLATLSEEEKPSIRAFIQSMVEERDEIQLLLAQLRNLLEDAGRK